jgi:hypothetical protein
MDFAGALERHLQEQFGKKMLFDGVVILWKHINRFIQPHGNFWIFMDDSNIISPVTHSCVVVHSTGGKAIADSLHFIAPLGMDFAAALERHLQEQFGKKMLFDGVVNYGNTSIEKICPVGISEFLWMTRTSSLPWLMLVSLYTAPSGSPLLTVCIALPPWGWTLPQHWRGTSGSNLARRCCLMAL